MVIMLMVEPVQNFVCRQSDKFFIFKRAGQDGYFLPTVIVYWLKTCGACTCWDFLYKNTGGLVTLRIELQKCRELFRTQKIVF